MSDLLRNTGRTVCQAESELTDIFALLYGGAIDSISQNDPEALEKQKGLFISTLVKGWEREFATLPDRSLKTFIDWLLSLVTESAAYEIVENTECSVRVNFYECPWASSFLKVDKPNIGKFFCEGDFPMVATFNPKIKLERKNTIMEGGNVCDFHFTYEND